MTQARPPIPPAPPPAVVPRPAALATSTVEAQPGLDELMLAMDVVDTLRHEQDVIARELNSDARDAAFVARVRAIYAGQGIEVSDEIIRQGVEALKQDRFTYVPPKRTFAVRLAEIYIDRWRWFRRTVFTTLGLGTLWVVASLPGQIADHVAFGRYEDQVASLQDTATARLSELESQQRRLQSLDPEARPVSAEAVARLKETATREAEAANAAVRALASLAPIPAATFADDPEAATRALQAEQARLQAATGGIATLRATLDDATGLQDAEQSWTVARATWRSLAASEAARAELEQREQAAAAALKVGDRARAQAAVATFAQAARQVDLAYELRIVNRPGVQSGVRRRAAGQAEGRSYYLVVEAVAPDGQVLKLPVTNEETQQVADVTRFAVRVPEAVYDRVRADKQDNGLIDDAIVGAKQRGELEATWSVETAGGTITQW